MNAHGTLTPADRGRNVTLLASSAIVSGVGTGASLIGVPWAIHSFTGSTVLISSYFIIAYGSLIVLLPKFSAIIDRHSRRNAGLVIYVTGFAVQSIVLVSWIQAMSVAALVLSGAASLVLRSLDQVNRSTLAHELVEPEQYAAINQWLETARQTISLLAGMVSVLLLNVGGIILIIAFDAATYLGSLALMACIKTAAKGHEAHDRDPASEDRRYISELRSAIAYAGRDRKLFTYLAATLAPLVAVAAQNAIYPVHFGEFLGASPEAFAFHAVVYGAGALLAAWTAGLRSRFFSGPAPVRACFVFYVMAAGSIFLLPYLWWTYACIFVFAVCAAAIRIERATIIMSAFDGLFMGRVNGLFEAMTTIANIALVLLAGLLVDYVSLTAGWLLYVIFIAVAGVAAFGCRPTRGREILRWHGQARGGVDNARRRRG